MLLRLKNKRSKDVSQDWFAAEIMAKLTERDRDIERDKERERERDKLFRKWKKCRLHFGKDKEARNEVQDFSIYFSNLA